MGLNKYKPHLLIVPEDDNFHELALGFVESDWVTDKTRVWVEDSQGGWAKEREAFEDVYSVEIVKNQSRHVLLLFDADNVENRFSIMRTAAHKAIEEQADNVGVDSDRVASAKERVFFLCCQDETEELKRNFKKGKIYSMGERLAESCYNQTCNSDKSPWDKHELSGEDNKSELGRLTKVVRPFIF